MSNGGSGRIAAREQRVEWMKGLNLFSNVFMSVALRDTAACQHVLRTLLGVPDLHIRTVRTQYRVSRLVSKDSELDVLAEDEEGLLYSLEVQRADTVDHARRVRYYGAMIDSEFLEKGKRYQELPDVYLIYVSETDLWRYGLAAYPVHRCFQNLEHCEDGMKILYANAAVDDGSERARMLRYFRTADPEDRSQGALSDRVHFLKAEEGGQKEMEDVVERIFQEGVEEGMEKGIERGQSTKEKRVVFRMLARGDKMEDIIDISEVSPEQIEQWKREWEAEKD